MTYLIDSQSLIWYVDQDHFLSTPAGTAISDPANDLLLSAAVIWEIGIKVGLGKLSLSLPYRDWMLRVIGDLGLNVLPINVEYSARQASLPLHHRDPLDRLLAAQAIVESVAIISADAVFDHYGVLRVWN